ncbi:F-box domain-containing protein [Mycena chlorophos]|uniref:F-box domain-containing protein n=1 Tax=Mycena chlorophos TaxID=658473 RepID=A0A8H6T8F2_MYCCL|nr:F-box domain-containing protein [Mycena chlorophos]
MWESTADDDRRGQVVSVTPSTDVLILRDLLPPSTRRTRTTMADTSLPDEIISEILSPALKVADDAFANNYAKSPFAKFTESTSAYLVVCKSWLRVATPLLYHVVVLRSKAQAKALANALAKNPDLGRFIKKLRVEGGFGPSMHTILQNSPNITDLFLSLEIIATDSTEGLCKGLPLINPARLILQCEDSSKERSNKAFNALINVLKTCVEAWDQLICFHTPYGGDTKPSVVSICDSVNKQRRLEVVATPSCWSAAETFSCFLDCPLREARILLPLDDDDQEHIKEDLDAKIRDIVVYSTVEQQLGRRENSRPQIAPSLNPFFVPFANAAADTQDAIFSRILYFAMLVPERAIGSIPNPYPPGLPLLLVCKRFHRVGLPHLYAHVLLDRVVGIFAVADTITANPHLASCIQSVRLDYRRRMLYLDDKDDEQEEDERVREVLETQQKNLWAAKPSPAFVRLFSTATSLRDVSLVVDASVNSYALADRPVSRDAFLKLARVSGHSLRTLGVCLHMRSKDYMQAMGASVFSAFVALETLTWKSSMDFSVNANLASALPKLSHLEVHEASASFYHALARMSMPSLRTLELRHAGGLNGLVQPLLKAHGSKLTLLDIPLPSLSMLGESVLSLCPTLLELKIACFGMEDSILNPEPFDEIQGTSVTLKKLSLSAKWTNPSASASRQMPDTWAKHIAGVPFADLMPNLAEISLPGLEWPSVEREITKHPWVRTAEALHASNISVSDRYRVTWRPRLKVSRGRR